MNAETALGLLSATVVCVVAPVESVMRSKASIRIPASAKAARAALLMGATVIGARSVEMGPTQIGLGPVPISAVLGQTAALTAFIIGLDVWATLYLRPRLRPDLALVGAEIRPAGRPPSSSVWDLPFYVLAATFEEVAFRGVAFHVGDELGLGIGVTLILSASLFCLQHASFGKNGAYTFAFGVAFGLAYMIFGSLYPLAAARRFRHTSPGASDRNPRAAGW